MAAAPGAGGGRCSREGPHLLKSIRMLFWKVFVEVLSPILVIFAVGWLLDRRCRLDLATLVKLNIYLFVPAFIFHEVVSSSLQAPLAGRVILFTLSIIAAMYASSLMVGT